MVGFYKHDIPAWMDGTESLSDGAYRAYHVVVQLIMLNEGPIVRNDRGIAGRCNTTVKAFQRALTELVSAGKLTIQGDRISNARAGRELASVMENRENAGKGGKTRAERAKTQKNESNITANSLQNKDTPQAALETLPSLKEKRREESPIAPKGAKDTEPDGFAGWFAAYPKRDGHNPRGPAASRYAAALKAGATPETLLRAVRAYAADMDRKGKLGTEYVKQAQYWLSLKDRLWEHYAGSDRLPAGRTPSGSAFVSGWSDDRWRQEVRTWRGRGGHWPWRNVTPPPDAADTAVPRHILAEMNIHPARAQAA